MNKKRPISVMFRLSPDEYLEYQDKVRRSGMKQQEFLLKSVLGKEIVNTDGMKELSFQLKKIGTNLNQIAASLNSTGFYDYSLISQNQKELNEIWQLLRQYLHTLE